MKVAGGSNNEWDANLDGVLGPYSCGHRCTVPAHGLGIGASGGVTLGRGPVELKSLLPGAADVRVRVGAARHGAWSAGHWDTTRATTGGSACWALRSMGRREEDKWWSILGGIVDVNLFEEEQGAGLLEGRNERCILKLETI